VWRYKSVQFSSLRGSPAGPGRHYEVRIVRKPCGYDPYTPLDALKPVADDVWIVDGPEIRFGPGVLAAPFPTRMTIVRLPGGGLWIHSPIRPTRSLLDAVQAKGDVADLVAPNTLHYCWIADWRTWFPQVRCFLAPGLERRTRPSLPCDEVLNDVPPPDWRGVIEQTVVKSHAFNEAVFFHRPSRTLILTDLIENFEPPRIRSRPFRWAVRLAGAADPDGRAPVDMRLSFIGRRRALRDAVRRMLAWDPVRVILAHGRWYQADGRDEIARAFRWAL
jgi:hypothetical protein